MKSFDDFTQWVQSSFFTKQDFMKLKKVEIERLKLLLEACPNKNEYGYNFWISGQGKLLIPELKTKREQSSQRIIDCLIISYFNHKI